MTHSTEQEIAAAWNAQADELNQWDVLDLQEKIEWAAKFGKNQAARRAQVVPQGWKLVPASLTAEMLSACLSVVDLEQGDPEDHRYDDGSLTAASIYDAMLSAAPQPPETQPKSCIPEIQLLGCKEAAPTTHNQPR